MLWLVISIDKDALPLDRKCAQVWYRQLVAMNLEYQHLGC